MKTPCFAFFVCLLSVALITEDACSRGGRGGGGARGGGGGHSFSRGGGGGGFSRPSPSMSRPSRPSVSRPANRPSGGNRPNIGNRPSGGNRPNIGDRPSGGNRPNLGNRPSSGNRPGGGNRPDFGNRPTQGQLQDFLNLPGTGNRPGGGNRPEIINRPGSGNRPDIVNRPGSGNRPGAGNRPGVGNRPGDRPGAGNRPGNRPGNIVNNRGPKKNNISINQINNNRVRVGNNVRKNWNGRHVNAFNRDWWRNRPGWNTPAWRYQRYWGRYPARYWWRPVTAVALTSWFTGWWTTPSYYEYGSNIYYEDNSVYYGDQEVATADEYYQQALNLADSAPQDTSKETDWMPLGVYAITNADSEETNMVLQLAVDKEGVIAGTFYNDITQVTHPVSGMVEKENQRASWHFSDGSNPGMVMETGIYNLTKDQTNVLVHFNEQKTQTWLLVRIPDPDEKADADKAN